jgi:hypothetical protein
MSDDLRIPTPGAPRPGYQRDRETRRLFVMAGGIGAVMLLVVVMWGVFSGGGGSVPLIEPEPGAIKVKPVDPGGLQINTMNNQLLGAPGSGAGTSLAPAPEAPDPNGLAAAAAAQDQPPPPPPPPPAAPRVIAPPAPPPQASAAPKPDATLPLPPGSATSVPSVPETPMTSSHNLAAEVPMKRNAAGVGNLAMEMPQAATPSKLASSKTPAPGHPAKPGHVQVQLAALDSEMGAHMEWARLTHRMPELLGDRDPVVMHAEVGSRSFWRLRTAGFASVADATRFCADVRAKGANCTVASF